MIADGSDGDRQKLLAHRGLSIRSTFSAWIGLLFWVALSFAAAGVGSRFLPAAPALALFLVQLVLNAVWSWLFFGLHHIGWALVDLVALWLAIAATLLAFWAHRPLAGLLMVPYLLWVSFAALLNYQIWRLNG
jgi:benzodiazapine receptor